MGARSSRADRREYLKYLRESKQGHRMCSLEEESKSEFSRCSTKNSSFVTLPQAVSDWKESMEYQLTQLLPSEFPWAALLLRLLPKVKSRSEARWKMDVYWKCYREKMKLTRKVDKSLKFSFKSGPITKKSRNLPRHKMYKPMHKIMLQQKHKHHPLTQLYLAFKRWFIDAHTGLFFREEMRQATIKQRVEDAIKHLQVFIQIMTLATIDFYSMMELTEIERDIVQLFFTRKLLKGSVYDITMNLLTAANEGEVRELMGSLEEYGGISLGSLELDPLFTLSKKVRERYRFVRHRRNSFNTVEGLAVPCPDASAMVSRLRGEYDYREAVRKLMEIRSRKCPEEKIDLLYELNRCILEEIEAFYSGYDVPSSALKIDHDNLLSIYIYIVVKSGYAKLWVDYVYAQTFLTDSSRVSNRGYFMTNLGVAMESLMRRTIGEKRHAKPLPKSLEVHEGELDLEELNELFNYGDSQLATPDLQRYGLSANEDLSCDDGETELIARSTTVSERSTRPFSPPKPINI